MDQALALDVAHPPGDRVKALGGNEGREREGSQQANEVTHDADDWVLQGSDARDRRRFRAKTGPGDHLLVVPRRLPGHGLSGYGLHPQRPAEFVVKDSHRLGLGVVAILTDLLDEAT